ncbi:Hypothetical_protein [Hexamita inflata]|uniref:Hypothetical_protein n=1 Tax=Hexamita inflata TaxID=28002 RepID=A0AA86Q1Q2_9EUKA|nr:Hypothetical protein HINF_LOCUS32407 [Hexamita inflata]
MNSQTLIYKRPALYLNSWTQTLYKKLQIKNMRLLNQKGLILKLKTASMDTKLKTRTSQPQTTGHQIGYKRYIRSLNYKHGVTHFEIYCIFYLFYFAEIEPTRTYVQEMLSHSAKMVQILRILIISIIVSIYSKYTSGVLKCGKIIVFLVKILYFRIFYPIYTFRAKNSLESEHPPYK